MTGTITFTIDSHLDHVPLIGLAINRICTETSLGKVEAYQTEVSVVEAVTNCIQHAYDGQPGHSVGVTMSVEPTRILFEIRDTGQPMPPNAPHLPGHGADAFGGLVQSGRGLFIMHAFMDEVTYTRTHGVNVLRLVKVIR